jgi:hypothetical protein
MCLNLHTLFYNFSSGPSRNVQEAKSLLHRCLSDEEFQNRRSWSDVLADVMVEAARRGLNRESSLSGAKKNWERDKQERYLITESP